MVPPTPESPAVGPTFTGQVSWLKILVTSALALVAAGAGAAIYATQFATRSETETALSRHESSDGHPSLTRGIQAIENRLVRVETLQQRAEVTQERMDDKLDMLLQQLTQLQIQTAARNPPHTIP